MKTHQLRDIDTALLFNDPEVIATSCRSLLIYSKTNGTCRGTLYCLGEHVLVLINEEEKVIEITNIFSVPSADNHYHTFVKGNIFTG